MPFQRILYRSESALLGSSDEEVAQLQAIVDASQILNATAGLTGALLLSAGVFIQALEGPYDAVEVTFERICHDLRHRRVRLLEYAAADTRLFEEWSMARVTPSGELARIGPLLDVASEGRVDALSAASMTGLMRSILLTGTTSVRQELPAFARRNAGLAPG